MADCLPEIFLIGDKNLCFQFSNPIGSKLITEQMGFRPFGPLLGAGSIHEPV